MERKKLIMSLNVSIADGRQSERYFACLQKLIKVMDVVQSDLYQPSGKNEFIKLRTKLMNQVMNIFNENGVKVLSETLMRMMVVPFSQKSSNPFAAKLLDFFFHVVSNECWMDDDVISGSQDLPSQNVNSTLNTSVIDEGLETDSLPLRILRLCEKYNSDKRTIVRLRLMQTIEKIVPAVIQVETIRRTLQQRLIRMLILRRRDKNEQIRGLALRNLCQFYTENQNVPFQPQILDNLLHHMNFDPEHSVRQTVLSHLKIYPSTWQFIVERAGDPIESIRVVALGRIAESIPLTDLTADMREAILKANTTNTSKKVETALNRLLKTWLEHSQNDPCEFLRIVNVRKRPQLSRITLNTLYSQPPEEAFEEISKLVIGDKRYPEDSLCIENVFVWLYMYERFRTESYVMNKLKIPVIEMIDYINEFLDVVEAEENLVASDLEYRSWMLGDMLKILGYLPEEEGERQEVIKFLKTLPLKKKLVDKRLSCIVFRLLCKCTNCSNTSNETAVIDLVNSFLETDAMSSNTRSNTNHHSTKSKETEAYQPDLCPVPDVSKLKLELGNLIHLVKKLKHDQESAVSNKNLRRAQTIQDEVEPLEREIAAVKLRIEDQRRRESSFQSSTMTSMTEDDDEPEHPRYSDRTMLITMTMVKESIQELGKGKVSSFSRTFYEMHASRLMTKCADPIARAIGLELMCMIGLDSEDQVSKTLLFCLSGVLHDALPVKEAALKCIFDLTLKYSIRKLAGLPQTQSFLLGIPSSMKNDPNFRVDDQDSASILKGLLLSYLRHKDPSLVKICVTGVLKLLLCKREVNFSQIMPKFLLNWATPSHELFIRFQDVPIIIPFYASMGEQETTEIAQCLMTCITKAIDKQRNGSNTVPCADIDKISNLIVSSIHPDKFHNFQRPYIGHQTIALTILEKFQEDLTIEETKQYIKVLKTLHLSKSPVDSIKSMVHSASEIVVEFRNKSILQSFNKFIEYLELILKDIGEGNEAGAGSYIRNENIENENEEEMMID